MNKSKELTTRQWDLYNYLKDNYSEEKFISKTEIAEALPQHYDSADNSTRYLRIIENDVNLINHSDTIQKIIVSNKRGYKIGNEAQVEKYLNTRFKRDFKSLKLTYSLIKKAKLDEQMKLQFGNERNYIESFMEANDNEN